MFEVNDSTFYTVKDLEKGLDITIPTLRKWIRGRRLKASKVGRNYMISGRELKAFLNIGTEGPVQARKR